MASRRGKKIDKWDLLVVSNDGTKTPVEVPVKMIPGNPTKFAVDLDYQGQNFSKTNENIDRLKEETLAWLKSVVSYAWEDFLYVEFFGAKPEVSRDWDPEDKSNGPIEVETTVGTALRLKWVKVATTGTGDKVYRDLARSHERGRVFEGLPDIGFESDTYMSGEFNCDCSAVLVRKTPETEAVLKSIVDGFVSISDKLRKFLQPDDIERRLAGATGVRLLSVNEGPDDDSN